MIARRRVLADAVGALRVGKIRHAALPVRSIGDRVRSRRRISRPGELEHATIPRIGYIDVAGAVERHRRRVAERCRAGAVEIAAASREYARLSVDEIRRGVARARLAAVGVERSVVLEHAIVARVRHVQIPGLIDRHPRRPAQAVGAEAREVAAGDSVVALVRQQVGLPEHDIRRLGADDTPTRHSIRARDC